jgi:hypothetical protein
MICDGWRKLADDRGAERDALALELERARLEVHRLRGDLERLSLDAHIMAEELERERAPKQDCR